MEKIDYCFHTHTSRCGHANGTDEEYVIEAIKAGIKYLGFSDHVMLPGKEQPGIRGNFNQLEDYIASVKNLKEKYKDYIKIYLGFECEYYPIFNDYYKELYERYGFDYLIMGQHCFINDKNEFEWYTKNTSEEKLLKYAYDVVEGMKTGFFKYVAHPDYFVHAMNEWTPFCEKLARIICEGSVKYNVPLEINLGSFNPENIFRNKMKYPYEKFFEIASYYGVKIYIGRDAHSPEHFIKNHFDYGMDMAKRLNLTVLNRIDK